MSNNNSTPAAKMRQTQAVAVSRLSDFVISRYLNDRNPPESRHSANIDQKGR
jgi:hypothetical protein